MLKPKAKSVVGKIRLCSGSEATARFDTEPAGIGDGSPDTVEPVATLEPCAAAGGESKVQLQLAKARTQVKAVGHLIIHGGLCLVHSKFQGCIQYSDDAEQQATEYLAGAQDHLRPALQQLDKP